MATSRGEEVSAGGSVLIVCTANICRSQVAAGLLDVQLTGTGISVSSAGTRAMIGHPPVPEAVDYVRRRTGTTLQGSSEPLTLERVRAAGLILTMTERQRAEVVGIAPGDLRRVFTLRQFVRLAPHLPEGTRYRTVRELAGAVARCRALAGPPADGEDDIEDPYGGQPALYEQSFALIARASARTAELFTARIAAGDAEPLPPSR